MAEEPKDAVMKPVLGNVPLFYTGRASNPRRKAEELPKPVRLALDVPSLYDPGADLIAAVNVALNLRLPLLLTGPPGTGKTELARSVAMQLHDGSSQRLYAVTVSSTSDKSDLLYRYDELARLRDAYGKKPGEASAAKLDRDYLELRGLGAAIVAAGGMRTNLMPMVTGRVLPVGLLSFGDLLGAPSPDPPDRREAFFLSPKSPPPVVLIDEIDKAPRELPNDLLTELDRMRFDIPELGVRIALPDGAPWPFVVITSNAERPLPDAFLRRCVCFHVDPPRGSALAAIIEAKLRALELLDGARNLPRDIAEFVDRLHALGDIAENEKPGTARALDFAVLLADRARFGGKNLRDIDETLLNAALAALLPSPAAQKAALGEWKTWRTTPSSTR